MYRKRLQGKFLFLDPSKDFQVFPSIQSFLAGSLLLAKEYSDKGFRKVL